MSSSHCVRLCGLGEGPDGYSGHPRLGGVGGSQHDSLEGQTD